MRFLLVVLSLAAAVGCTRPAGPTSTTIPSASASPTSIATPAFTPVPHSSLELVTMFPVDPTPQPPQTQLPASIVDPIIADAAGQAGVDPSEVAIVSSEAVTWPNAGLGCPLPGVNYPEVPVDGYRLVVAAGGQTLDYRGGGSGGFRLCSTNPR